MTLGATAITAAAGGITLLAIIAIGLGAIVLLVLFLLLPLICISISGEVTRCRRAMQAQAAELARLRAFAEADFTNRWRRGEPGADSPTT